MRKQITAIPRFVSKHRVAIAVTLTAAVAVKWQYNCTKEWNAFLKAHDLFDEYYAQFAE